MGGTGERKGKGRKALEDDNNLFNKGMRKVHGCPAVTDHVLFTLTFSKYLE